MFWRRRALKKLYDERARLARLQMARPIGEPAHPHTQGMRDSIDYAISVLEGRD